MDWIEARSIFSPATGFIKRGGFDWTCNPYLGCTFGCSYCYAMFMPQNREPRDNWGRWITAKKNAVALAVKQAWRVAGKAVYLSSVTDPYQPVERSLFLTRGILEAMLPHQPRLIVQTRGPLVIRDSDLFQDYRSIRVNISIPTDDEEARRRFEPKAPPLEKRWEAVTFLQKLRIPVGICVTPTLPIRDVDRWIDRLVDAEAEVLVIQDFHDSRGAFGADTSPQARSFLNAHGWNELCYRAFRDRLKLRTKIYEGEAGFFPPPSVSDQAAVMR